MVVYISFFSKRNYFQKNLFVDQSSHRITEYEEEPRVSTLTTSVRPRESIGSCPTSNGRYVLGVFLSTPHPMYRENGTEEQEVP